ncbi:Melibiose carrier protein [Pontiella desulfatans]|uniref:Melibiose carrier protein n=1 Tax=Pontiella desulfatans TaxID=2750659 RepID=A0A6C2TXZ6_PONDE|nr:MFS transporter [Pontiella desulfatans]VGO12540.1 Melibiose carrier protein [Pontiella desulfatans]
MEEHQKTAEEDRVGKGGKLAYGMGAVAENAMQNGISVMANPFFNVALNVAPSLLGIAVMLFRIWDAITDPIMGWISDRTQSRFGRRRPYIVCGAIAGGVLFALMWWCPRGMGTTFYFTWYMVVSILFYTAFTVFGVPYVALGYELSPDYHERTRIMSFRTWFQSIAGFCIQWLFWLTQRDCFDDTVDGMRWVGIGFGALMIIMGITPGIFLKERRLTSAELDANHSKKGLRSVLSVFKVKPFVYLLGALVTAVAGMFLVIIFGFYINVYYIFGGDMKAASTVLGAGGTVYHVICMASIPLIAWTSTRLGKKAALQIFLFLAILGNAVKWWVFTPGNPWLQLIATVLIAPGLSAVWTLLASMTADVTDLDELENGTRREGAFGAFYGWTMKLGFAICFFVAGLILEWTGFDAALGGAQSPDTLKSMLWLYAVVPVVGLAGTMLCVWRFPITENVAREVRKKLDARNS